MSRLTINIEFGDLGMKAGLARSWVEGGIRNILIDPSRHTSATQLYVTIFHELSHAGYHLLNMHKKEERAKKQRAKVMFDRQVSAVLGFDMKDNQAATIDGIIYPDRVTKED